MLQNYGTQSVQFARGIAHILMRATPLVDLCNFEKYLGDESFCKSTFDPTSKEIICGRKLFFYDNRKLDFAQHHHHQFN
jgi:hypothetical protein